MSETRPPQAKTPGEGTAPVTGPQEPALSHQPHPQQNSSKHSSRWNWLASLPILIAIVCYFIPTLRTEYEVRYGYGQVANYQLASNILDQFRMHDLNGDGRIDPYEFANLLQTGILGTVNVSEPAPEFVFRDLKLSPDKEAVTIMVDFESIRLETMIKFKDQTKYYFGSPEKILPGLIRWKTANKDLQSYGAGNFKFFLPPDPNYPIGDTYNLIEGLPMSTPGMHMYRYHPLQPSPREAFLFALLSQFHPNVFLQNRFGPRGSMAIVRARNGRYLDIMMRVHAEYQLNDEPNRQFWFTPAQYTGRLIIDKEAQHVEFFELYLPTNQQLNIDMEWITGDSTNEVDIGFVPEMRLHSLHPSVLLNNSQVDMSAGSYNFSAIKWDEEISVDKALVLLGQGFYPFKKIPYLYFTNAMDLARQQEKLVHFILLWGALDDQSC